MRGEEAWPMFKNILIPTDGSRQSQKAAARGVELAKRLGARVTGFFAAPPATPVIYRNHFPAGLMQPAEHAEMIRKTATKYLQFIERAASRAGVRYEGVHVTNDYPAAAILDIVKKKRCDSIVMATHGRGGLRGMVLGSVTQKVLNQSKVPVIVFR
jgi:nucleotide-binding universal stress UspA family protein